MWVLMLSPGRQNLVKWWDTQLVSERTVYVGKINLGIWCQKCYEGGTSKRKRRREKRIKERHRRSEVFLLNNLHKYAIDTRHTLFARHTSLFAVSQPLQVFIYNKSTADKAFNIIVSSYKINFEIVL